MLPSLNTRRRATLALSVAAWALSATTVFAAAERDVTRATLDNGLQVVIVRNTLAPVAATSVNYLAGSDETPPGFPGTAHALHHFL